MSDTTKDPATDTPRRGALRGVRIAGLLLVPALAAAVSAQPGGSGREVAEVSEKVPLRRAAVEKLVGGTWTPQGPGPTTGGQVENVFPDNEVVGAIHTAAAHPTNPNILYVGAVNGGIWKTTNATATSPSWVRQTDAQASLSIGALEFDPFDGSRQTLVAGIGQFSSYAFFGGERTGLLRTTNGGLTWTPIDGGGTLTGLNVSGVAPRGTTIVVAVNSGLGGIWRSTNTGASFSLVSGAAGTGLPPGVTHDLVGDPLNAGRLFTGVANNGIYRSDNTGATWTKVSDAALDTELAGLPTNVELAVGRHNNVYVAIARSRRLSAVFRSGDGGGTWTEMDLPETPEGGIHIGRQASRHMSIAADPTNSNIVYVGGDRQPDPFPNSIGALDFSGRLFRGDASQPAGSQWVHLTHSSGLGAPGGGTASSSSPHADSREMVFDAAGNLIETDDGGIYKRTFPRNDFGDWFSLNGDIQTTEFHDSSFDTNADVVIGGAQDTGTPVQDLPDQPSWFSLSTADGGDVAAVTTAPGTSVRYSSLQFLGAFRRTTWDGANNLLSIGFPPLTPIGGSPSPQGQFTTPIEVNPVDPQRLAIGADNGVFESLDQGDTVRLISTIRVNDLGRDPLAYGAGSNPDVIYAGFFTDVYVRIAAHPAPLAESTSFPGSTDVVDIAIDPADPSAAYVATVNAVYQTLDAGASWTDVTGNLFVQARQPLRSLAYLSGAGDALAVGSNDGVFIAFASDGFSVWDRLGSGLPTVPVFDLDFDAEDNVLVAGTLGRGSWKLTEVLEQDGEPPVAEFTVVCTLLSCDFDGSLSTDNVGIESYIWDFGDGSPLGSGVTTTHLYAAPGKYTVTLTVIDFAGNPDSDVDEAIADAAPPVPVIDLICNGLTCDFDGSGSTDDTEIVSYEWDFGDGSPPVQGIDVTHTYASPGVYTVTLTVIDCAGKSASASATVDLDEPPVACFEATCSNLTCTFDASCSTDDLGIESFSWDFGDGATDTGQVATHPYFHDGVFTVTLTVTDTMEQTDSVTADVTVVDEEAFIILHVLCP